MVDLLIKLIIYIISLLDKTERSDEKLINSHILDGVQVLSDKGWSPAAYIHKTKPFEIYTLTTEKGKVLKCADEHIVFRGPNKMQVWVSDLKPGNYINTIDGLEKVVSIEKSDTKVCMCDVTALNNDESYYSNGILSHNTTTSAIFLLHYILFNVDKNSLVLGNKGVTAREILDKVKKIYYELPYFLKPGIYKWNESQIVLDNGCMCMAEATTINSGISFTFHCVLADEFAHIQPNILDKFYNNLFPTITAGKARFIISSTQNGYNLFYRLWNGAIDKENEYAPFKVDWWQVPEWNPDKQVWEKRDEAWHKLQIANYGGEENFNKQFGTNFDISGNSLISTNALKSLQENVIDFESIPIPGIISSNYFYWKKNFDLQSLKQIPIVITVDISEGLGQDYTIFSFSQVKKNDNNGKPYFEQIGYFRCNDRDCEWCAGQLAEFCMKMFSSIDTYLISIEYNLYGELFMKCIREILDNMSYPPNNFNEDAFVKYWNDTRTKYMQGIRLNHSNKLNMCKKFKNDIETGKIISYSPSFINELTNFSELKAGSYGALVGHDDLVMSMVQLEAVVDTLQYKNLLESVDILYNNNNKLFRNDFNSMNDIYAAMSNPYFRFSDEYKDYNPEQNYYSQFDQQENDYLKRLR